MANVLFDALLRDRVSDDRPLLHLPSGASLTAAALLARAARFAHVLKSEGVRPGDRVVVQVEKSPEALALYFACLQAGAVFVPLNTAYTAAELAYFIGDAEPALVVCDPAAAADLAVSAERHGATVKTLAAGGTGTLVGAAAGAPVTFEAAARGIDDLAAILYTSGTTGRSKGAMLSHGNLLANTTALADAWRFTADDVLLHALPIFHTHGLFVACQVILACRGAMIFLPKFDAEEVLRLMPGATVLMGVPTFYTRLLSTDGLGRAATAHMRLFISGSAPLLEQTHEAFARRTGHSILERYGLTETGINTSNPYEGVRRAGTVGRPLAGVEVRITDPDSGTPLEEGAIGMIEVRGPNVFRGYWRQPDKTRESFRKDGFFITGDLGCREPDGSIRIVGRGKDLIISGGFNIYPKEIESAIDALPGVLESAVIGVPHPDFGEAVVAVIVPQADVSLTEEAVLGGLGGVLARFKHPKKVVFAPELPRNTMGKVQKNILRERHAAVFS